MKGCIKATFDYLSYHCAQLYAQEFDAPPEAHKDEEADEAAEGDEPAAVQTSTLDGLNSDSLELWQKLIALVAAVVEEDRIVYTPVLNQCVFVC